METLLAFWNAPQWGWAASVVWPSYLLIMAVWILLQRHPPAATLGWLLSMAFLPVVGLGVYYVFGPQRLRRQRRQRLSSRRASLVHHSAAHMRTRIASAPAQLRQIARLIFTSAHFPVSTAHELQLLCGGAATFDAILQGVRTARGHVHLQYYIFEPDHTGHALLAALTERARAGVQVRLLIDALGSKRLLTRHYAQLLAAGGMVELFHAPRFGRRLRPVINWRTHRKMVIIDGHIAFTGGVNITDEEDERRCPHAYHDMHLRLSGPVVGWLQTVFLEDWAYARHCRGQCPPADEAAQRLTQSQASAANNTHLPSRPRTSQRRPWPDAFFPSLPPGEHFVQILTGGPDNPTQPIHRAFVSAIEAARQRLWLTTPYFVPTSAALLALSSAALRGVDVRVLVPERSDSALVTAAARSYFDELMGRGVKIYEYRSRMLHSKTLVVDTAIGIIGTANFDMRSFKLNYEVCAVVYDQDFAQQLAAQFESDLQHAQAVPRHRPQPFLQRLGDSAARLFSPLL